MKTPQNFIGDTKKDFAEILLDKIRCRTCKELKNKTEFRNHHNRSSKMPDCAKCNTKKCTDKLREKRNKLRSQAYERKVF